MRRIAAIVLAALTAPAHAQMIVDGDFADWPENAAAAEDPAGDASGPLDAIGLAGVLRGSVVQVALAIGEPLNLQSGAEADPDLWLVVDGGAGAAIEIRFRGRAAVRRDTGQTVSWELVRYASAPTVASHRFEIRVDLSGVVGV
jgi:hypothetical protein